MHPIPSQSIDKLNTIINQLQTQFNLFEQVTGINLITLGQTPSPDAPVATTEAALQATMNTIKPVISGVFAMKEEIATSILSRAQIGIRISDYIFNSYSDAIGKNELNLLRNAEKFAVQYGLTLKAKPDALYKQNLKRDTG